MTDVRKQTLEDIVSAENFHEIYERLAPSFGYETRTETRKFNPDSPNGKLMIAVCKEMAQAIRKAKCVREHEFMIVRCEDNQHSDKFPHCIHCGKPAETRGNE